MKFFYHNFNLRQRQLKKLTRLLIIHGEYIIELNKKIVPVYVERILIASMHENNSYHMTAIT